MKKDMKMCFVTAEKKASKKSKNNAKRKQSRKESKNVNYMTMYLNGKF